MAGAAFTFKCVDNLHDPATIKANLVTASINFNLLDSSKCRTRRGRTLVSAIDYHSLYADDERMLGCHGGTLYDLTGTPSPRYTFATDHPLVYQAIPNASLVISNGEEIVFMVGNSVSTFDDPPLTESIGGVDIPTNLDPMPGCYLMAWLDANLYMATIVGTETHIMVTDAWNFEGVPRDTNLRFTGLLRMMAATEDTLWVSDGMAIYSINDMKVLKKCDYPAVKNGFTYSQGEKWPVLKLTDYATMTGTTILVTTEQGIVALGNGGQAKNLSIQTTALPVSESAASGMIEQDGQIYYITSLNGTGTAFNPYNAANIDVEIY